MDQGVGHEEVGPRVQTDKSGLDTWVRNQAPCSPGNQEMAGRGFGILECTSQPICPHEDTVRHAELLPRVSWAPLLRHRGGCAPSPHR